MILLRRTRALAATAAEALRLLVAAVLLAALQPLLRRIPTDFVVHLDDAPPLVGMAEAEHTAERLARQLRAGLVHADNGEPLRRPVVVRADTTHRLDAVAYSFAGLADLERQRLLNAGR